MITILVDPNIHSKSVRELAGALVLALLGELEPEKETALTPEAAFPVNGSLSVGTAPNPQLIAALQNSISELGPHLVLPNPPNAPGVAQGAMMASVGTMVVNQSAPPAAPATIKLDSKQFPWDERIHASSKTFNKDGTWRGKRGVTAELIAGVEAELRKLMAIPSPAAQIPALVPGAIIPPPPPPVTTPSPTPDLQAQYVQLVMHVASLVSSNRLTNDQLNKCFQAVGISQITDLGIRLDLLPTLSNIINGIVAGQIA